MFLRTTTQRTREHRDECVEHVRAEAAVIRKSDAKAPWEAADPLANRDLGKHFVHEMRCHVRHAACGARGTEGSSFAREGDHHRVSTALATQMHEAVFENAATKILIELGAAVDDQRATDAASRTSVMVGLCMEGGSLANADCADNVLNRLWQAL